MTSPGECWTADTSEYPNEGAVSSSLADVLEGAVAAKYYLSPKAAAGILRRASRRGRALPHHLEAALMAVVQRAENPEQVLAEADAEVAAEPYLDAAELDEADPDEIAEK